MNYRLFRSKTGHQDQQLISTVPLKDNPFQISIHDLDPVDSQSEDLFSNDDPDYDSASNAGSSYKGGFRRSVTAQSKGSVLGLDKQRE